MSGGQIAYAAVRRTSRGIDWIMPGSVHGNAKDVRRYVGRAYTSVSSGDAWRTGWKRALKDGYRVRRIVMQVQG